MIGWWAAAVYVLGGAAFFFATFDSVLCALNRLPKSTTVRLLGFMFLWTFVLIFWPALLLSGLLRRIL